MWYFIFSSVENIYRHTKKEQKKTNTLRISVLVWSIVKSIEIVVCIKSFWFIWLRVHWPCLFLSLSVTEFRLNDWLSKGSAQTCIKCSATRTLTSVPPPPPLPPTNKQTTNQPANQPSSSAAYLCALIFVLYEQLGNIVHLTQPARAVRISHSKNCLLAARAHNTYLFSQTKVGIKLWITGLVLSNFVFLLDDCVFLCVTLFQPHNMQVMEIPLKTVLPHLELVLINVYFNGESKTLSSQ